MNVDEDSTTNAPRLRSDNTYKWLGLLTILAVAALLYFRFGGNLPGMSLQLPAGMSLPELTDTTPSTDSETVETADDASGLPLPVSATDPNSPALPQLDASDATVASEIAAKMDDPIWVNWLADEEMIRKTVAVIDNAARGEFARKVLALPVPNKSLQSSKRAAPQQLDQQNYARYDSYVDMVTSLDNDAVRQLYIRFQPLMQQAYTELGYPDQQFGDALASAFEVTLATPDIDGPLRLQKVDGRIVFVDEEIENLPDLQKLLIRIGPVNRARLKQKIGELQAVLFQ